MAKRTKVAQFRLDEAEDAHLRKAAADAGFKALSDYLRAVTLHPTVVVVSGQDVVLIPSTITLADADEALQHRFRTILAGLQGQETSPAPATGLPEPPAPADSPAAPDVASGAASPAPDSSPAPLASPGGGDGMVGTSTSQAPPADPEAAAGAIPGPGETPPPPSAPPGAGAGSPAADPSAQGGSPAAAAEPTGVPPEGAGRKTLSPVGGVAPGELEAAGADACPGCGGVNGQHQGFCEQVRGEPPVTGTEPPVDAGAMTGSAAETREQFVNRRISEQEAEGVGTAGAQLVAEAEWRQIVAGGREAADPTPPPTQARVPCPTCGTLKLPTVPCRDCGTRPEI